MQYDISKFEELVEQGYLRKSIKGMLTLFGYTDQTTFDRHWNEYTRIARGLILDGDGNVVAKCFPKFFNLSEMEETQLNNLPDSAYEVFDKADGSLGILFYHNNQWQVSTRGSFYSEQAIKGAEILKKYNVAEHTPKHATLLVEIIYPGNKIVVDYGTEEKLVLLAAFDRDSGMEYNTDIVKNIAERTGLEMVKSYNYTINEMIELQKTIPKDQEGFVVRFENGLRVKIKGAEYLKIAKMLSNMSPISFWESMEYGMVKKEYLLNLPEEFRPAFEPFVELLESQYKKIELEIEDDLLLLPTVQITTTEREWRKTIGLFIHGTNTLKHKGAIFPMLLGNQTAYDKYIMKVIRPDGNILKEF